MADERTIILIVEDNVAMLRLNARMLLAAGHVVLSAQTLREARAHLVAHPPDAVVLDILLPDGNGLDFLREIREITDAPVLLVTSLGDKDDRLAGLLAGGDDYIAKPYDIDELVARVNAFLRRERMHREKPSREIVKGSLRLDLISNRAYLHGADMLLTQKEFALLNLLAQNEGNVLTKVQLYESVWQQPVNDDSRAVKAHLSNVRRKIEGSGYVISTARGEGYCFERV